MPDYTTLQAKRQKRKYAIDLTNSPLLKTLLELLPISRSISYPIPPKGPLQASPIKRILSPLEGEATRTSVR